MKTEINRSKKSRENTGSALTGDLQTPDVKPGRYRHFKGNEYEVLYIATHSETLEQMVVYRALYGERGIWVRPLSMWNDSVCHNGGTYKRFTYIGK